MLTISQAESGEDLAIAHKLFSEYAESLGFSLCFQSFEAELAGLPGKYARPSGCLMIARNQPHGTVLGCIALRKLDDQTCEMKRLYVRPEARGNGVGWALVLTLLDEAIGIGYTRMRLDTVPGKMDSAIAMYRALGFKEIPPYYDNPIPGALYLERDLSDGGLTYRDDAADTVSKALDRLLKLKEKL